MNANNTLMSEAAAPSLHPDALLALQFVRDASLSSRGGHLAFVISRTSANREYLEVWLQDVNRGNAKKISGDAGCAMYPRWSPDGERLAFVADGGLSQFVATSGKLTSIRPAGWGAASPPSWSPDGRTIVISKQRKRPDSAVRHITRRSFRLEGLGFLDDFDCVVVVIDLETEQDRVLAKAGGPYMNPQYSPTGKQVLFMANPPENPAVTPYLYVTSSIGEEGVTCIAGEGWFIEGAAWVPDADTERIAIAGDLNSKVTIPVSKLWIVNKDGSQAQLRTPSLEGHVGLHAHHDMPIWGLSGAIAFAGDDAVVSIQSKGRCGIWRVSLHGATQFQQLVGGDRTCILLQASETLLYITTDEMRPTELAIAELNGTNERQLTHLNKSAMADWPALKMEHLNFCSIDGTSIEAWFMSRDDCHGPQPTVLYIHGGPFLGQGHYFRFDTHLLAANGISVLFANFRGSSGYGESFSQAVVGDWGARGFPDHMATVDAAIEAGFANPDKLGVWGHSHGGFATCWIVGHTNRFVAAIAEAAVTSFETMYYLSDCPDGFALDLGGSPFEIPDVYRSRSPLAYARRCKTPTRIIHGENDLRCTLAEAEQFYRALLDNECESDLVILRGCDHLGDAMGPIPGRIAQNEALLGWFHRWLKPSVTNAR